jgi:hypothetical protein
MSAGIGLTVPLDAWRSLQCIATVYAAAANFCPREGCSDLKAKAPRIWAKASMAPDVASVVFLFSSMSRGALRPTDGPLNIDARCQCSCWGAVVFAFCLHRTGAVSAF